MNSSTRPHNFLYRCRVCNQIDSSSGIGCNDYSRIDMALNIISNTWDPILLGTPPNMLGIHSCPDGKTLGVTDFIGIQEE